MRAELVAYTFAIERHPHDNGERLVCKPCNCTGIKPGTEGENWEPCETCDSAGVGDERKAMDEMIGEFFGAAIQSCVLMPDNHYYITLYCEDDRSPEVQAAEIERMWSTFNDQKEDVS